MNEITNMEPKKTHTIGLFIDWIDGPFQHQMLEGVEAGAKKYGLNLYCFVGGAIDCPNPYERSRNFIYNYATGKVIDGLIIMATPVGNFISIAELNKFRTQYQNIPVVSIAQQLENTYTVRIDNITGLKGLVNHLIRDHGYKNIAIIKGPENNTEAIDRFKAYQEALAENGIPLNEELVVPGLFHEQSGYEATIRLLTQKDIRIDAIVAANDDMAFGAIKAIQEQSLNVPYDIAVTGFDDQFQCRHFSPSISTVKMPIFQLGFDAVGVLSSIFNHQPVEQIITLPTKPVIRESCGCAIYSQALFKEEIHPNITRGENRQNEEYSPEQRLFEFLYEGLRQRGTGFSNDVILHFSDLFISSLQEKSSGALFNYLSMLMNKDNISEQGIELFFQFFLNQKTGILGFFETPDEKADADYLVQIITQHIFSHIKKNLNYNRIKMEREFIRFRNFGGDLAVCSNTEQIIETLLRIFPILDTRTFYLSFYNLTEKDPDFITSDLRLVFAYRNQERIKIDVQENFDPFQTLVPKQYLDHEKTWSLIVEPVFFGPTRLGLAIFDIKMDEYIDYVMRRRVLNDALNYTVYVQKVLSQSRNLEKTNDELSQTLNILKETQEKLIQSEKMSVIGNLVAGISHEINTPIGISVTAASHLDVITREISGLYATNTMKKSDFEKYLKTAEELSAMILNNLQRAHELIGSFKQVAVDQSNEERRKFNVKEYVDQILLSLKPALKKTSLDIDVKCPDNLELLSFPGALYQIITNLVMNSAVHGYDKGQKGNILIEISVENNHAWLKYSDDGKGINPAIIDKIFDPFVTTRRGQGGTGLGLHIVYNLVSQTLNGSIQCTSLPGNGAAFTISFPVGEPGF